MTPTAEESVNVLFAAAGLTVPDDDKAAFVEAYPFWRAGLDALYAVPMIREEEPQLTFDPTNV